jgi:hypothetical protein
MPERKDSTEVGLLMKSLEIQKASMDMALIGQCQTDNFNFKLRVQHDFREEEREVAVTAFFGIYQTDAKELGAVDIQIIYSIANWAEVVRSEPTGELTIPEGLRSMLNSLTISTSRGVVFTLFHNAKLSNVIFPIIDPANLVAQQS